MRIAFYAPMKSPAHPNPSGDRNLARLIIRALKKSGHEIIVASHFRSYDRNGKNFSKIFQRAKFAEKRALNRLTKAIPDIWFTYHLYHKAPDLLGPAISNFFEIPYVVADASYSPKQMDGPWATGFAEAEKAILRADKLICFDPLDASDLSQKLQCRNKIFRMTPFVDHYISNSELRRKAKHNLSRVLKLPAKIPYVVTVAMMRNDIKAHSYKLLANCALKHRNQKWALLIAGDGPMRNEIENWFAGVNNVRFLGILHGSSLTDLYLAGDFMAWPALREGCAMALLEATASGLPILAGKRPGLEQFVKNGKTGILCPEGATAEFEDRFNLLLSHPEYCKKLRAGCENYIKKSHTINKAAEKLNKVLSQVKSEP